MRIVHYLLLMLLGTTLLSTPTTGAEAVTVSPAHGVILLYHRVTNSGPDATRVSPERFTSHLNLLANEGYAVLPLQQLLEGVYNGAPLPDKSVAITFDDAYRSVGEIAYPLLKQRGLPFSVFVATDVIDAGGTAFLSWADLETMAQDPLVSFGGHSLGHEHMELLPDGKDKNGRRDKMTTISENMSVLKTRLGSAVINAFAYPYGEYGLATEALLAGQGIYGLAQQSGAVGSKTRPTRIPRFPLYHGRDDDDRLRIAITSRPLPVIGEQPAAIVITADAEPPSRWQFRVAEGQYQDKAFACYSANGEPLMLVRSSDWFTVTLPPLTIGRNKINCTAPAKDSDGYYWYSRLWVRIGPNGLPD